MKLEHCKIEPVTGKDKSWVNLGFSISCPLTPGLVQEIGRRIENFLMMPHTSGVQHDSGCATHNAPAYLAGPCDCSVTSALRPGPFGVEVARKTVKMLGGRPDEDLTPLQRELLAESLKVLASAEEDDLETIDPTPEPVAEVKPAIRRNRGKMLPPVEVPYAPVAGTPLRVRGKPVAVLYADTEPAGETPAAEPTPAPAPRRTRTPAPEAEPEITDIELAKAASEAAAVIPLAEVKALIAAMGVTTVNQIEGQEKRKEFLDVLRDAVLTEAGG